MPKPDYCEDALLLNHEASLVDPDTNKLIRDLRRAGLSQEAIDAAWPSWWSDDAAASPSGRAELRFALSRKLGVSPRLLLGQRVEFVWRDKARFKSLSTQSESAQSVLSSFGVSVAQILLQATPVRAGILGYSATDLRGAILQQTRYVDLTQLIALCWALGVPVIHLRVFPLPKRSMHAMVVESQGRHAVLLARSADYPAPVAFTLAHEIGHIARGHIKEVAAVIDMQDPATSRVRDFQEEEATSFALELLTGSPAPKIETQLGEFNSPTLAQAALAGGPRYGIEPGMIALCLGYQRRAWPLAMSALKFIYSERKPVWKEVNTIAERQLDWQSLSDDNAEFLGKVMFQEND